MSHRNFLIHIIVCNGNLISRTHPEKIGQLLRDNHRFIIHRIWRPCFSVLKHHKIFVNFCILRHRQISCIRSLSIALDTHTHGTQSGILIRL